MMTSSASTALDGAGPRGLAGVRFAAWFFIVTGVAMTSSVLLGLPGVLSFLLDLVFWPLDGAQSAAAPEVLLLVGICGGLIAGWGYTVLLLARHGLAEQGATGWAWRAAMGGLVVWFVIDGAGSIASGASANIVGNLTFLLVLGIPLLMMRGGGADRS